MPTYGLGGQERKVDNASESIAEIPLNRTLLIEKLTADPPIRPQVVTDLTTIGEVFEHFQPETEVEFDTEEGSTLNETLRFRTLGDFSKLGIINQSRYLQDLNRQVDDLQKFVRHLRTNKILKTVLENSDARQAYLSAIQSLIQELEEVQ